MSDAATSYLEHMGIEVSDELKHYGKKGMKWGVRNDDDGGGGAPSPRGAARAARKEAKAKANQDIVDARMRQGERANALERQAFKTYAADGEKAAKAALAKYSRMEVELLTNPDANTASRMTSGEKISAGIVTGIYGGLLAGSIAYTVAAGRR